MIKHTVELQYKKRQPCIKLLKLTKFMHLSVKLEMKFCKLKKDVKLWDVHVPRTIMNKYSPSN